MPSTSPSHAPLTALGMSSLVIGIIALVFAPLPILGIPVGCCGLLLGFGGVAAFLFLGDASLRWSLAGIAVSSMALTMSLAINLAPANVQLGRGIPKPWPRVPDRAFVPPPAQSEID